MPVVAAVQLLGFLICIISGFVTGIIYDVFTALRKTLPAAKLVTPVLDMVFWIAFTLIFFITLQLYCGGEFHWYSLCGALLGFILYFFTLSKACLPVLTRMLNIACKLFGIIYKAVKYIFTKILHIFEPVYKKFQKFVQYILKKLKKFVKKTVEISRRFGVLLNKV